MQKISRHELLLQQMTTMAKAQGQEVTEQDQEEMIKQAKNMSMGAKRVRLRWNEMVSVHVR
jgi:hypothetical protein